jgi:hypothetical protein
MSNPVRTCLGCSQVDDHPRKVIDLDGINTAFWHYDCHAQVTGCEYCTALLKDAGGKTGDDLRDHLMSTSVKG